MNLELEIENIYGKLKVLEAKVSANENRSKLNREKIAMENLKSSNNFLKAILVEHLEGDSDKTNKILSQASSIEAGNTQ